MFHSQLSLVLLVQVLVGLLWPEVWLVVLFFDLVVHILSVTVILNLLCQEAQVSNIVFLFELLVMFSNNILLLFLPSKLFPLEVSNLLNFFTFLYKTVMSLFVDLL